MSFTKLHYYHKSIMVAYMRVRNFCRSTLMAYCRTFDRPTMVDRH